MTIRPRCKQCRKPAALRSTMVGKLCKRCCNALPSGLRRDPAQPRPNADRPHRATKRAGAGIPAAVKREPLPTSPRARKRNLQGR